MGASNDDGESSVPLTEIAFTDAVKRVQRTLGSRDSNQRMSDSGRWLDTITDDLARFIASMESVFLGTANGNGQPYIQHRGGSPGFIEVVDRKTLRIADRPGNRQYISLGNLSENDQAFLFFIDYETKTRIKIWGSARIDALDDTTGQRAIVFTVKAWDVNCQKYLPSLYRQRTVEAATAKLTARIEALERELAEAAERR